MGKEKAILVGVSLKRDKEEKAKEFLDELEFLALTAGAFTVKKITQRLENPDTRTYVRSGKLNEIKIFVETEEIDLVIFDDELSAAQLRNIEKEIECRVIDRTHLILDIFAKRAQTAHAKTQVELAQYQYLMPRLKGMWTHLERQKGGIGLKGPGEKEIETDRRIIRDKITKLKKDLEKIDKQKVTQRKNRGRSIRVALIGYTNVGKSTLMNVLSKSTVFAENKLFATLDTTVRKVVVKNLPFLMSDTVGFIRKLPHHLVESFKSTLDEVREADLLLHVVDISHPTYLDQIEIVQKTIHDIGAADKPTFLIFNKIDAYSYTQKDEFDLTPTTPDNYNIDDLKNMWIAKSNNPCIFISAKERQNLDLLKKMLYEEVRKIHITRYPYDDFLFSSEYLQEEN